MKNFQIYKHPIYGFECVKIGFSWPALFFGIIWMLVAGLWLNAVLWVAVYALTLYVSSAQITNLPIQLVSIAIYISLWLVPAFQGNSWRSSNLQKRGFNFLKVIHAQSADQAKTFVLNDDQNANEKSETEQNTELSANIFLSNHPSQENKSGAFIAFVIVILGVIATLIVSKPNEAAFMSYLLNGDRMQAEIASQLKPGDTLSAMALLEDIFSIVAAAGNKENLEAAIIKRDYLLFTLYSAKANFKSNQNTLNNLAPFKKIDAARLLGFNSTYIGIGGTFFHVREKPLENGVSANPFNERNAMDESNVVEKTRIEEEPEEENHVQNTRDGEYANERYQYLITYPRDYFIPQGESDNGDGQTFMSKNSKIKLVVFGRNQLDEDNTLESEYEAALASNIADREITYQVLKQKWYVISGIEGDTVFYEKKLQDKDKFISLILTYPKDEIQLGDKLLKNIDISSL